MSSYDFDTIQEAIDDPDTEDGHTITVDPDYTEAETKENILVSKKLTIKSSSGNSIDTVIEAADNGKHVIEVTADDVTIQGFTIKGATEQKAGICLHGSTIQGCTISQNFITENKCGIYLVGVKSNTIQENVISGNELNGIDIKGKGTEENKVIGNYIGTDKSGTKALGNQNGIAIWNGAKKNIIGGKESGEGNIISGNTRNGIYIFGLDTNENEILGNYMGTDKDGTNALPNEQYGVQIEGGCENWIGRYGGGRNVISGNKKGGVMLKRLDYYGAKHNEVLGNYIGTDKDGTKAVPNEGYGVSIIGSNTNHIGGKLVGQTLSLNGNVISGNKKSGIYINSLGLIGSDENEVLGNYIGTDKYGTTALPNEGYGVVIKGRVCDNFIGRYEGGMNVISGNKKSGVLVEGPSPLKNEIQGNYIGTDKDGTSAVPNEEYGIEITNGASYTFVGGRSGYKTNGNVISGNKKGGVLIKGQHPVSSHIPNFVLANLIGTNKDGTVKLPNEGYGIEITDGASGNWIGRYDGGGNLISGNKNGGVLIKGKDTDRNEVLGNYIGTHIDGTSALPNEGYGVELLDGPTGTRIGGKRGEKVRGNIISGNKKGGVLIKGVDSDLNWILGNYIGTDPTGTVKLPNEGYGVEISVGPRSNYIGSEFRGQGNIISGNKKGGVLIKGKQGIPTGTTRVSGNYIGTNKDGTKLPNKEYGVEMLDGTWKNYIHDNKIWYNCGGIREKNSGPNKIYRNDIKYNTCSTGIHLDNSNSEIIGNTISDDEGDGIKCEDGSNPTINWNNILNNIGYGVNNPGPSMAINAQHNWWGAPDGPGGAGPGSGDEVSDYVNYSNWLDAPVGVVPHIEVEKRVWDPEAKEWTYEIEADVDDIVRFRLFVHNDGVNCSLSNIVVNDTLPANLEYADNATHEPDVIVENRLTWNFAGPLEPCENITIEFDARVIGCGDGVNVVNATAWCEELQYEVRAEDRAAAKALPSLEVEKEVWDTRMEAWVEEIRAEVGDNATFQLWIHHDGSCCPISGIVVEDTLPEGLEFVSAEPVPKEVTVNPDNTTMARWNLGITLEPCENTTIELKANVTKGRELENEVSVNATGCGYVLSDTDEASVIAVGGVLEANFRFVPTEPRVCQEVRFFDETTGGYPPYSYEWDFNNDTIVDSTEANPTWNYTEPGTYTVTLKVNDTEGNTDTTEKIITVHLPPNITAFAPPSPVNDTVCNLRTFNVTVNQTVNVSWYLNGSLQQTNESVREASCTRHAEVVGEHNVSAIASNENGTDMQTWIWNVTAAPEPVLEINKTDNPDPVSPGGTLNYSISVNNTGYANATNVTVMETYDKNVSFVAAVPAPSSGNDTWQFATLNVSETRWINISVTVNASVLNGTVLHNIVNVTCDEGVTDFDTENTTVFAIPNIPNVKISKWVKYKTEPDSEYRKEIDDAKVCNNVSFMIAVQNNGTCTNLTGISVTDVLNCSLGYINGSANIPPIIYENNCPANQTLLWQFATVWLEPGEYINITFDAHVDECGNDRNYARVDAISGTGCNVSDEDYVYVNCTVQVCVETATGTGIACFDTDFGTIEDLVAVDESTLPEEGKPELVFPHGFFSFNITGLTPNQTVVVTITLPDNVPVGTEYWKYHASEDGWIRIPMGSDDGDNIITITLVDGGLGDDDGIANGVIVDQGGPGVRATKPKLTKSAPASVAPGGTITYTILYANVGPVALTEVTITENYPEGVTFISADPAPDAGTNNKWTIGTLPTGASGQIIIKVEVQDSRDLSFTETGSVTGEGFVMVSKDLSTEQKPYRLKNVVTISCAETDPVTTSASTTVSGVPGTSLDITEHGSGIYESEEILNFGTKNKSIRLQKSTEAEYQPTSFYFSDGFSVVFTNMWMQDICSKNMILGDAMHKKIKDATYIRDETKTEAGEYGTEMEFASSFQGAAHIGAVSKDVTTSEDYIGEFEIFWAAKEECQYLFNWSRVPGNDSEKLIRFLVDTLAINWAENATITKSDDDRIINIYTDWHSAEVILAANNETATVKVGNEIIYVLDVRTEDGTLNVYDCRLRKISESVTGEGYVMVDKELTSGHIQVVEHGSGIYSSDTDFNSQRLNKSTEAEYQPTTFNFSDGFGVNFSSKWVQGICSKDKKAGTAIHKKISDAVSMKDDTTATKSSMAFETSFNGSIHVGARATGTRISEDYIGVFNITEKIEIGKVVNASTATPVPDWLPCPFPEP